MTQVANVFYLAGAKRLVWSLEAELKDGKWTWKSAPRKVTRVVRLEVLRAGEQAPCMALDADGSKDSLAILDAAALSLNLNVLCPLAIRGSDMGWFEFAAQLTPRIFDGDGHTTWSRFTTKSSPVPLPGDTALPALVSGPSIRPLGANVIQLDDLIATLPFKVGNAYPDTTVDMVLRSCKSVGSEHDVYLIGFLPRTRYEAKVKFIGATLSAPQAWTEVVQSAESLRQDAETPHRPPSWLFWLNDVPGGSQLWNEHVSEPYRAALAQVAAGEDASFMPDLASASFDAFSMCFRFEYERKNGPDIARRRLLRVEARSVSVSGRIRSRFVGLPLMDGPGAFEFETRPTLPEPGDADADTRELYHAWPSEFPLEHRDTAVDAIRFRIRLRAAVAPGDAATLRRTRFGSLDLGVAGGSTLNFDATVFSTGPWLEAERGGHSRSEVITSEVRAWEMAIADVRPGAEDPVPDATRTALDTRARSDPGEAILRTLNRRPPSLVVHVGNDSERTSALLEAQEQTSSGSSRSFVVRLRRDSNTAARAHRSVVYLSREPFLVAKVVVPPLVSDEFDSDEFANWSLSELEGRKWELAAAGKGFELQMPPTSVGEAMEKGWEQPVIEENRPVDFRFSAPAQMRLQSSWFPQGYAEAPWNLARVLGYPGQRAPGARVDRLTFELVYGITTVVDASQVPSRLSLAELASRLGNMAPILERVLLDGKAFPEGDVRRQAFLSYRARWAQMLNVFRARLAVLELYAPQDDPSLAPKEGNSPLALQQGVTAYLRRGRYAREQDQVPPVRDEGADLRYPILPRRRPAGDYHDEGLAGGFAWPFESDAIFKNLLRDPVSNEAWVSGLRFSALGAWGDQRASFDNKRTKIITSTAMGRLSRITVERVGRIGVFWNRSKHVIVYERTVLANEQYEPPRQKALTGRAVLRKVAEYVEVLEPDRRYPEFGAAPVSRGCVEGIHFASRRILVNSDWGADTATGFEIPLWDPTENSRIYPRPSIFLATSGDNKGIAREVPREIKEPDRLYFFSATDPKLDDRTDLWPSYAGTDYGNEPRPQPEDQPPLNADDPDANLPDSLADLPGWRRFTFPLEDAQLPTNIVSERTQAASLSANLTHLSMMRAAPNAAAQGPDSALVTVDVTRALLAQLQQNAAAAVRAGWQGDELKAHLTREMSSARASLSRMAPAMSSAADVLKTQLTPAADDGVKRISRELTAHLTRQRSLASQRLVDWKTSLTEQLSSFAAAPIEKEAYENLLTGWESTLTLALPKLGSGIDEHLRNLSGLLAAALQAHADALDVFEDLLLPLTQESVNTSFALEWLAMARQGAQAALQAVASLLPRDVPPLLQGAMAKLRAVFKGVEAALDLAFDVLEANVASQDDIWMPAPLAELAALKTSVFGDPEAPFDVNVSTLATPLQLIRSVRADIQGAIDDIMGSVPDLAAAVIEELTGLAGSSPAAILEAIDGACKDADKALQAYFDDAKDGLLKRLQDSSILDKLRTGALAWDKTLGDLAGQWTDAEKKLHDWIDELSHKATDEVENWARDWAPDLRDAFSGVESLYGRARSLQEDLGKSPTFQDPSTTLRLIRAVGEGPLLPEMTFNRDRMAYFFDDYASAVRSSPVAALVNRVGDDLKALGIRLPTQSFLDRVIPDSLQNFDLSKILPDFAALKNSALFEKLKLPAIANDTVKVTHGIDEANRVPWLKANVDIPITERASVFSVGPLAVVLPKADFHASTNLRQVGGVLRKEQEAWIKADWLLEFGGLSLVTFTDTTMSFDEGGGMKFDIRADRIRLDPSLKWVSDLMQAWQPEGGSGLKLEMVYDNGRPVGVACNLAMALPPIGAGVFAMSGLMLGAGLRLAVDKESGEFAIGITFNLSRKVKPFTLTIAFLNGGGWVEAEARYLTSSRAIVSKVSIGIVAGAGVEFALGPCAGSVYVQFGIFVEFSSGGAGGQTLSIGVMLLVRGSVVVFSIASVTITLLLQAVYRQDGSLTGYGSLSVSIRVSQFFKISYSTQVTYNLAGGGGGSKKKTSSVTASSLKQTGAGTQSIAAAERHSELFQ